VEESLQLARELGEDTNTAAALFMEAELDLVEGDVAAAEDAIRASLRIYSALENDLARAGCLVVLAAVAAAQGSMDEAARLIGAADGLRGETPLDRHAQTVLERFQPALEAALGADELVELKEQGRRQGVGVVAGEFVTTGTKE
jgi:ATP/maltotriose-dependent transcriptional regulator MalT